MAYSSRSSDQSQDDVRLSHDAHDRMSDQRTTDRDLVQSDELSATNGARMISIDNPYDPSKDPHLDLNPPDLPHAQRNNRNDSAAFVPLPEFIGGGHTQRKRIVSRPIMIIVLAIIVVVGGFFAIDQLLHSTPVQASVNGETMTLEGNDRTIEGLLNDQIVEVTPGNFIAVDESILREGEGTRCTVTINDQQVDNLRTYINEGDQVVITDGIDVMEEFTESAPMVATPDSKITGGQGALHVYYLGKDGEKVIRTGSESGISVDRYIKDKEDDQLVFYNPDTNGEKVIALTFDDGPWDESTDQILDILKEYDAKATFFTIGRQIPEHTEQIKRMAEDGHDIATHTWDHALGSGQGVSLSLMSTEERQEEVQKGLEAIEEVTGEEASAYFRAPGGNLDESTATDLRTLVAGEIGWNVDTQDWTRPGVEAIAERIKNAQPGEVILMHDGGGDRSQTVEALREALAYLSEEGYEFITISEMIERYPYSEK